MHNTYNTQTHYAIWYSTIDMCTEYIHANERKYDPACPAGAFWAHQLITKAHVAVVLCCVKARGIFVSIFRGGGGGGGGGAVYVCIHNLIDAVIHRGSLIVCARRFGSVCDFSGCM